MVRAYAALGTVSPQRYCMFAWTIQHTNLSCSVVGRGLHLAMKILYCNNTKFNLASWRPTVTEKKWRHWWRQTEKRSKIRHTCAHTTLISSISNGRYGVRVFEEVQNVNMLIRTSENASMLIQLSLMQLQQNTGVQNIRFRSHTTLVTVQHECQCATVVFYAVNIFSLFTTCRTQFKSLPAACL